MMDAALLLPFNVLPLPPVHLNAPSRPSWTAAVVAFFVVYFFLTSGIVYDVIKGQPSMGMRTNPKTGLREVKVFLPNKINQQFIIEGFAGAFTFCFYSFGLILVDWSTSRSSRDRSILLYSGIFCCGLAFFAAGIFMRTKAPSYMAGSTLGWIR
jgi:hypothetical protein